MLRIVAAFIAGIALGYLYSPRQPTPPEQPIHIINKIPPQLPVMCPEIICETEAVKENLNTCLALVKDLTDSINEMKDDDINQHDQLEAEKQESAYWKKKYVDFDCE